LKLLVIVHHEIQARQSMKLNESSRLMLLLVIALAPGSVLSQSARAAVAGRVMGLPKNATGFQVALASDHSPCSSLQTHTTADGSFRFSSVYAGDYRVAVSGLPEGYGIKTMTAGGSDLLSDSVRLVASTQNQVLIEVARVEDMRRETPSVVHVGIGLRSSCLIHQVKPVYPSQAKAAHIVGNVILSVGLDKNGYIDDVMVIKGHPLLIQSAIGVVRQWRYVPVVLCGETVPVVTTVVVPFGSK
jgi:TonB family protein